MLRLKILCTEDNNPQLFGQAETENGQAENVCLYNCMIFLLIENYSQGRTQSKEKSCNCRDKHSCPLSGDCLIQNVVYQATIESPMGKETYIGGNATELSKYIWSLKDAKTEFAVTWKIMARARPYSNVTKKCNLCITEKFFIICKPGTGTLNKRNELASACRHATKYLIKHA